MKKKYIKASFKSSPLYVMNDGDRICRFARQDKSTINHSSTQLSPPVDRSADLNDICQNNASFCFLSLSSIFRLSSSIHSVLKSLSESLAVPPLVRRSVRPSRFRKIKESRQQLTNRKTA